MKMLFEFRLYMYCPLVFIYFHHNYDLCWQVLECLIAIIRPFHVILSLLMHTNIYLLSQTEQI